MNQNSYQTRRLLALRDMRHDGQNVVAGGEVFATQTDATYLIRMGHARDPEQAAPTVQVVQNFRPGATKEIAATVAAAIRRGPGRPTRAETAARSAPRAETSPETGTPGSEASEGGGEQKSDAGAGETGGADGAGQSGDQTAG